MNQNSTTPEGYELESVGFRMLDKHCCLVEPVRPSGFKGDIYVIDQEGEFAQKTSMLVRVVALAEDCSLKLGAVYVVPVYAWEDVVFQGETYHMMHEDNAKAELEGYDNVNAG